MRWALALIVLFVVAGVPAALAAKKDMKDPPGKAAVSKADAKATFEKEHAATHAGRDAKFIPCDIGHLNDGELAAGFVIGKLDIGKASKDGLAPGTYKVYVRKQGGWQVFFCQGDKAVGCAEDAQAGLDNEHRPKFVDGGAAIRYGWYKFSY
jgi:hypothetical protein